ncbi:ubiquinol-cytochrome c reductase iron-sulfur subunit [Rubrolithibacter danxiaensis]|uniref:QcrA and Rieske domain-containing protein n=1 Tax=Rubrolithibacter danxiaensis TaxID=3390805 RepID=UPI003BF891DF
MKTTGTEQNNGRRNFLMKLSLAFSAIAATAAGIPVLGALFEPLLEKDKQSWRNIGQLKDFSVGNTRLVKFANADVKPWAGVTAKTAAWVRREGEENLLAFAANCTHLGCPVRWEEDAELFMCPCHGGVYYKDGTVAAGPPPKSLTRYQVRIKNGIVQIKTAPVPITEITA